MDQITEKPFTNFSSPQQQPTAGTLARAIGRIALWSTGSMLAIGASFVVGNMILQPDHSPGRMLARLTGQMESDETKEATAAKAEQERLLAMRRAEAQARVDALRQSMQGEIAVGEVSDMACAISRLFGQGYSQYADVRDGLAAGCGISGIVRQHMMSEFDRNLDGEVH